MDFDIESGLYRIFSGSYNIEIDDTQYNVKCPSLSLLHKAQKKYLQVLEDYKFDSSWLSKDLIDYLLLSNNIWNNTKEKEFNELTKVLDNTKKEYYLKYINRNLRAVLKNLIDNTKNKINTMYSDKHSFYHLTLDSFAQNIKSEYIITQSVYLNNELVFKNQDLDNIHLSLLYKVGDEIHNNALSIDNIKYISRNDLWKSYWNCGKEKIFNTSILDMTDEQRTLINITRTHDIIKEHPECPSDDVLNDDDALDGWVIFQNEKAKKEKAKQELESKYGLSNKNADEVFILTDSQEEMKEIFDLNDDDARSQIREMKNIVKQKGEVQWQDLPSVEKEIRHKFNQMQATRGGSCGIR